MNASNQKSEIRNQTASTAPAKSIIVIGGGLAGIAAAVRLAGHGLRVTLVETRKRLGGRATSFTDPATGRTLDNCQHVLLRCCTNLIDLYERLGVAKKIAWHDKMYFADGAGHVDVLEADDLPAPLHVTRALMQFKGLTLGEKLAIARGMLAIMRADRARGSRGKLHHQSFADWLIAHGQPPGAVEKFWSVIIVSACNELPERVAADYALQVFQEGFLANEKAYLMGLPGVPLVELYDAAQHVIEQAGGNVILSESAERLHVADGCVTHLELANGRSLDGDAFIFALPFDRLEKICSPQVIALDDRLAHLDRIEVSPILGIHLWFDYSGTQAMEVMTLPHLILTRSPLQWLFNKGDDLEVGGQHLHGVISAAHDLVDWPAERIIDLAVREARRVLVPPAGPGMANARLLHAKVIKEKRATFSALPGVGQFRPGPRGRIANLYLAGDWCDTGWPATMEGATRSGYSAASALLEDMNYGKTPLVPDLEPSALYRALT